MRFIALVMVLVLGTPMLLAQKPSLDDYGKLLEQEGYGSVEVDNDDQFIRFKAEGETVMLFLDEDLDFQLYAGYIAPSEPECGLVNLWNRDHRFFRSYVDDEGDYVLEYDHIVSDRESEEELALHFRFFVGALGEFQRLIYE